MIYRESFQRRINVTPSQKQQTVSLDDYGLFKCEYITLYVDGDDVESINSSNTNKPLWNDLKKIMDALSDYALNNIRGELNSDHYVSIEFNDEHDNVLAVCELPNIGTDNNGYLVRDFAGIGSASDIQSLCIAAFNKLCYLPS